MSSAGLLPGCLAAAVLVSACSGEPAAGAESAPDAAADGSSAADPMDQVDFLVADEYDPYPVVESQLPLFASHPRAGLCQAIHPADPDSPELEHLLRAADAQGIAVVAWLLLPTEQGYWFGEDNLAQARTRTIAFLDWVESKSIPLRWVMFDMEMTLQKTLSLQDGDLYGTVLPLLGANRDPAMYQKSKAGYRELVMQVQARGFRVAAAAYPFVLDDMADGDDDIQDAVDTPIVGVPFDEVWFMTYRTSFRPLVGATPGPEIVYQYAREGLQRFGNKASVSAGVIGGSGMEGEQGFATPAELAIDIGAGRAGGSPRTFVFSLDGMLQVGEPAGWMATASTGPSIPAPDDTTAAARARFAELDSLLGTR